MANMMYEHMLSEVGRNEMLAALEISIRWLYAIAPISSSNADHLPT